MLRRRRAHGLLIALALPTAAAAPAVAQTPAAVETRVGARPSALPSRVTFQNPEWRHRPDAALPATIPIRGEPRALWLARLAAEGWRPVHLDWRSADTTGGRPADPFADLTLDVKGTPTLLPLYVATPEKWTRVMESLAAASSCPCTEWSTHPGRTPDGRVVIGSELRLAKNGNQLVLSWGASCSDDVTDYTVHEGTLGSWYSHQAIDCSTGDVPGTTITPAAGSTYYLIVPVTADAEGSYGSDSTGQERPKSTTIACRAAWDTRRCP